MTSIGSNAGRTLAAGAIALAAFAGLGETAFAAEDEGPIKIGVIAEAQAVAGASIPKAAKMAADEINANGGVDGRKIEIITYDNHSSAAESVRAFQRAVKVDGADAVISSYISEVVLALMPWAARLETPLISPGASSDLITHKVHENYDKFKYVFHGYLTSTALAKLTCKGLHDVLVEKYDMDSAVIFSEDAAWTVPLDKEYLKCLPEVGLDVLHHFQISPSTTDFTPIFNQIESIDPDVIVTGISHIGTQPTVQWKNQQVPIPMAGISSQATADTFWDETNGDSRYVVFQAADAPMVPITEKTVPFAEGFKKLYGGYPSYCGYTAYDDVYIIANAVKRAGTTDPKALVKAMEKTDYVGTIGHIEFYGKDSPFTHGLKFGEGGVQGLLLQWQKGGEQAVVWPNDLATGKVKFPDYMDVATDGGSAD